MLIKYGMTLLQSFSTSIESLSEIINGNFLPFSPAKSCQVFQDFKILLQLNEMVRKWMSRYVQIHLRIGFVLFSYRLLKTVYKNEITT